MDIRSIKNQILVLTQKINHKIYFANQLHPNYYSFIFQIFLKGLTYFADHFPLFTFGNRLILALTIDVFVCTPHVSKQGTVRKKLQVLANF